MFLVILTSVIKEDVSWLGYKWDEIHFASDYFNELYNFAIKLIQNDKAYIDSSSYENIKKERGTLKEPGKNSKDRERSKDESLKIFNEILSTNLYSGTSNIYISVNVVT